MSSTFLTTDYTSVTNKITNFISQQVRSKAKNGVVLGLSGGIDSSICAVLACRALGNKKVAGLFMPEKGIAPRRFS